MYRMKLEKFGGAAMVRNRRLLLIPESRAAYRIIDRNM
jgi:hypothetical protein